MPMPCMWPARMRRAYWGAQPSESYLRGDVIIQAALDRGAEAIHPGYGFLSENPDFVEAVEAAGLTLSGHPVTQSAPWD